RFIACPTYYSFDPALERVFGAMPENYLTDFGRLLDHLERTGLDDTTIVVFAGDHGEEFLDHDGWGHGATLYEEQLHVPLVVRLPDRRGAGRVVRGPVQQVDLLPTLLDALGHVVPTEIQGESRFAAMTTASERAAESTTPQSFAELHLDGEDADALFDGRFKLIADGSGEHIELFDLSVDPAEQHDLARERPVLAGFLRAQLLARREASAARTVGRQAADLDPEARSRLEALGYLN
ncbi:MAG: sulfatase-like hydrolase/transferase, partial [Acidobacteriota bacterium]